MNESLDSRFRLDWTRHFRTNTSSHLLPLQYQPLVYLEIGIYEGRSACWMLENVLLHPSSRYIGVDPWIIRPGQIPRDAEVERRARQNLAPYGDRVQIVKRRSQDVLADGTWKPRSIDIAYIDGEHTAVASACDSLLVWPLVKVGGIIIWDDLGLKPGAGVEVGLRYFLPVVEGRYEVLFRNWQLGVRKTG